MRTCSYSPCKRPFVPKFQGQRHCSTPCRDRMLGRKRKRGNTTERGLGGEYQRNRLLALERDGWTCLMPVCKQPTRVIWRDAPRGSAYPSADHIIPRSLGGTSELSNLRASHLGCNVSAGAILGNQARAGFVSSAPRIAR